MPEMPQPAATPPAPVDPGKRDLFAGTNAGLGSPLFCWLLTGVTLLAVFLFLTVFNTNLGIWLKTIIMLLLSLASTLVSLKAYTATQKPHLLLSLVISGATLTGVILVGSIAIYFYESFKHAFSSAAF